LNKVLAIILDIRTVSEANSNEHWTKKRKRHVGQKNAIFFEFYRKILITPPCSVKLTRLAPRLLDSHDNLPTAFKWIVDAIAEQINKNLPTGQADNDKRITWEYDQIKSKDYAIKIEVWENL
jgi:hypothetical protein